MTSWRRTAAVSKPVLSALLGTALAAGPVAVPSAAAAAQVTPVAPAPKVTPCPIAAIPPPPPHPPRPVPPPREAPLSAVGGNRLATPGLTVPDGAPAPPANLTATSWLVADLDSGAVIGACGPHEQSPPASVQKLLLAATVLPLLDPAQVIEVTPTDLEIERNSSAVGLVVGGKYPVSTLWLGLLLQSGNDAANALARTGGGDAGVAGTMTAMNAQARHLGALDTHAATPSGLDGAGQFTSAYDLALIARVCFARDDFRRYDTTPSVEMPAQPPKARAFQIQNENKLLTQYKGALGGKTGFTELARHTYVGAAERNGRRLVVTILGAEALPVRAWQQGAALLDWGFAIPPEASVGRLVTPGETDPPPARSTAPQAAGALGAKSGTPRSSQLAVNAGRFSASALAIVGAAAAIAGTIALLVVSMVRRRRVIRRRAVRRIAAATATAATIDR